MPSDILLIFIKNPVLGRVKTRLAKDLGDEKALEVYQELLAITHKTALGSRVENWLYYSDFIDEHDEFKAANFCKKRQIQSLNLGDRLKAAFKEAFDAGAQRVVVIGSDCPELTEEHLVSLFGSLRKNNLTICPAQDGGYVALGMTSFLPALFEGIDWSSEYVFEQTLERFRQQTGSLLRVSVVKSLRDLDDFADWNYYAEQGFFHKIVNL